MVSGGWRFKGWVKTVEGLAYVMTTSSHPLSLLYNGGIVVRILHHVHQVHDVCIFVPMRLFWEKAAWDHQAHDTDQLNIFYMMIGHTHHEKQTSCT